MGDQGRKSQGQVRRDLRTGPFRPSGPGQVAHGAGHRLRVPQSRLGDPYIHVPRQEVNKKASIFAILSVFRRVVWDRTPSVFRWVVRLLAAVTSPWQRSAPLYNKRSSKTVGWRPSVHRKQRPRTASGPETTT